MRTGSLDNCTNFAKVSYSVYHFSRSRALLLGCYVRQWSEATTVQASPSRRASSLCRLLPA